MPEESKKTELERRLKAIAPVLQKGLAKLHPITDKERDFLRQAMAERMTVKQTRKTSAQSKREKQAKEQQEQQTKQAQAQRHTH